MNLRRQDFRQFPDIAQHPAALFGNGPGNPRPIWPKPNTCLYIRFADRTHNADKFWALKSSHCWFGSSITCPQYSDKEIVRKADCPVCAAVSTTETTPYFAGKTLTAQQSFIVDAFVLSQNGGTFPVRFAFPERYLSHFKNLIRQMAFDPQAGFCVTLIFEQHNMEVHRGEAVPVDRLSRFQLDSQLYGDLQEPEHATLSNMAAAYKAHVATAHSQPPWSEIYDLRDRLPGCTLLPIPYGFKGPIKSQWQNTSYQETLMIDYRDRLERGNVGCLCGFDQAAYDQGLIPRGCVVGLDADDERFAAALLQRNPWLRDTFAVKGRRGIKYFVRILDNDLKEHIQSKKIVNAQGKDVGDWLSGGKQGIVAGLHPAGVLYKIVQEKVLLDVSASELILPPGFDFARAVESTPRPRRAAAPKSFLSWFRGITRQPNGADDCTLDRDLLENVQRTSKGIQARCPACAADGRDSARDNLLIYPDGHYCCAAHINCADDLIHAHNRRIFELSGKRWPSAKRRSATNYK